MRARRAWAWAATLFAFPVAGLVARALAGPVDDVAAGLIGGLAVGAVVGVAQGVAARDRLGNPLAWAVASALAGSAGLAVGGASVDWMTSLGSLAAQGAITGAVLGAGQAALLTRRHGRRAWVWIPGTSALWATGLAVTTSAGIDVDTHWAVFGASGAAVVTVGSGLLLRWIAPARQAIASSIVGATSTHSIS